MKLEVMVGDLVTADVEAIVNAANTDLEMGGGVAGAIKRAGGDEIEEEAMAQAPIQPGESVVTSAGTLRPPIRWVVHAATMGADRMTSADYISAATTSALAEAARIGASSVAYPALGAGVGRFRMDAVAELMVAALLGVPSTGSVERVVLYVKDFETMVEFDTAIARPR